MTVTNADGNDTAEEIEIAFAVDIPNKLALTACEWEWFGIEGGNGRKEELLMLGNDFSSIHLNNSLDSDFEMTAYSPTFQS